jgi:hypothetical protein
VKRKPEAELLDAKKLEQLEHQLMREIRAVRRRYSPKRYLAWIEAHYVCSMLNWCSTLDECMELRARLAPKFNAKRKRRRAHLTR